MFQKAVLTKVNLLLITVLMFIGCSSIQTRRVGPSTLYTDKISHTILITDVTFNTINQSWFYRGTLTGGQTVLKQKIVTAQVGLKVWGEFYSYLKPGDILIKQCYLHHASYGFVPFCKIYIQRYVE